MWVTWQLLHRLRADQQGVAFVEFAMATPVFVLMVTAGLELTSLALTHVRLSRAAETLADNVSRVTIQVDETDIEEIFQGVALQAKAINLEQNGRLIVSSLEDNGKTGNLKGQKIRWQRCDGEKNNKTPRYGSEGKGTNDNSLKDGVGPVGRKIAALPGTAVIFAEVAFDYQPILFRGIIPNHEIRYETAFNVRERDQLGITNSKGRPLNGC